MWLVRFVVVAWLGFAVQIAALGAPASLAHWSWLPATVLAVALAVVHTVFWHQRWTWADRLAGIRTVREFRSPAGFNACAWSDRVMRFVEYGLATGLASLVGNVCLTTVFLEALRLPAITANVLAVGTLGVLNFVIADRWVFRRLLMASFCLVPQFAAAQPGADTLEAWNRYVATTEARVARTHAGGAPAEAPAPARGESVGVPSGLITDWRGAVLIRGVTLDRLLAGLLHPGTPPPQEDVVSSRVLAREGDSLRVSLRLVRRTIVTVVYDTEHEIAFHRWSPSLATARSVATSIREADGGNRGFLWRLNSYWRYQQYGDGVIVELESLTLSRSVPSIVRPVALPIVGRVARESMERTLEALRAHFETSR